MIFGLSETVVGWICVLIACFSFGSFAVPMKAPSVLKADVHPLVFQSYKVFWVLVTCWLTIPLNEYELTYSPWGIVSGLFWVPAGVMAVVSVYHAGLAVSQSIWGCTIVMDSFLWGLIVFHEKVRSIPLSILAAVLLVGGLVGMATFSQPQKKAVPDAESQTGQIQASTENGASHATPTTPLIPEKNEEEEEEEEYVNIGCCKVRRFTFGLMSAIFSGTYGGSILAPLHYAGKKAGGIDYVVSFGIGATVVTLFLWFCLFWINLCRGHRPLLPPLHLRVMAIPGAIAGILWSIGNVCSVYAVLYLGEAIGYSCLQVNIAVSGLWGVLWYREVQGWRILYWSVSLLTAVAGVLLLAYMHKH